MSLLFLGQSTSADSSPPMRVLRFSVGKDAWLKGDQARPGASARDSKFKPTARLGQQG